MPLAGSPPPFFRNTGSLHSSGVSTAAPLLARSTHSRNDPIIDTTVAVKRCMIGANEKDTFK